MKFADTFVAGKTVIEIVFDDITNATTEIIVNSVCNYIHVGKGVSGAIYQKAGKEVYDELDHVLDRFTEGSIYVTSAGKLPYKHIFHAISSNCHKGTNAIILKSCVENTLKVAREKNIKSIGFPALGTGDMNFDINDAAEILIDTVIDDCFKNEGFERIVFYLFRPDAFTSFFRKAVKATIQEQQTHKKGLNQFVEKINNCEIGLNYQSQYESIVAEIFKAVFVPPLMEFQEINRQNSHSFTDLLFPNYCDEGFWNLIDRRYDAKSVIVTCFNEKKPEMTSTINILNKYFENKNYGNFAILVCREKNDSSEHKTAIYSSYKKYGGIILSVDDFDVAQLVELKSTEYEPEKYLQRKISEFLLHFNDYDRNFNSSFTETVREFMIKGEIEDALNTLLDYTKKKKANGLKKDLDSLLRRHNMNDKDFFIKGIISIDEHKVEAQRLLKGIEFILDEIK